MDGGRAGNKSALTTMKVNAVPVTKSEKTLQIIYDEDSILARTGVTVPKCRLM